MRLINADAFCAFLREVNTRQHYETLLTHKDKYPTVADVIEAVCCDLDGTSLNGFGNAPTVELDESVIQEVLNKRCMTAVANEYLIALHGKRPQGEWIFKHNSSDIWCSVCDISLESNLCEGIKFRYCPNCGAYMGGTDNG